MEKKKILKAALNAAIIVSALPLVVSFAQSEKQAYTKPDITKHGSINSLEIMQSVVGQTY